MKTRQLLAWMLTAFAIVACKEDNIVPEDPEAEAVTLSVRYSETTEGIAKPESVILTVDNKEMEVTDGKFYTTGLEEKDSYIVGVYNKIENVTVTDGVISINGSDNSLPSIDWLFCYAGEKKLSKSLSVTLQQQTKQINVVLRAMGHKIADISEVTAELTEVAGQRDLINKVYRSSSTVSATMEKGVLAGSYFGILRVLGFIPDEASTLKLNFKYNDGSTSSSIVDISGHTESFNDDKTMINVIKVSINEVGSENEVVTLEVLNNGTLENKDDTGAAEDGAQRITINWPSYNTASRIEIKADGNYYVGELDAATATGQTTKNGFAELPAADKIEEIVIYVGSERIVVPAGYYTYDNGVITVTDCKLVYKSEHMNEAYITQSGTFVQTADIKLPADFAAIGAEWKFTGTYDGQGFAISGLNAPEARSNFALFRFNAGTVKNVVIKDSKIVSSGLCAGIATQNEGSIINCISYLELQNIEKNFSGGIVGQHHKGLISRCEFHGTIKVDGGGIVGGMAGASYDGSIIEYCLNTGLMTLTVDGGTTGGIAGRNRGLVRGCKNTGNMSCQSGTQFNGSGGVVGLNDNGTGKMVACVNTGSISGKGAFGGVVGVVALQGATVTASYNTGLIVDAGGVGLVGKVVGWFAGRNNNGNIDYCYTVSEGQPKTSNGVFGNGNIDKVDIKKFENEWPEADATKGWGIYTEGCDPTQGYYWKTLGNSADKTYPVLFWEE